MHSITQADHKGFRTMKYRLSLAMIGLLLWATQSLAASNALEGISYAKLPGDQVQLVLKFREPPKEPLTFTIEEPARIALDFPDTEVVLKKRKTPIGVGVTRSVVAVPGKGRARVVINQTELSDYQTRIKGNQVIVHIGPPQTAALATDSTGTANALDSRIAEQERAAAPARNRIEAIDFRRGPKGEARIVLKLSNPRIPVDVRQQAKSIIVEALNTGIDDKLQRRMDVTDFATPVETIDTFKVGNDVRIAIRPTGEYEQLAYQTDETFTIEIKPLTKAEVEKRRKKEFTGERLSLNFQDIEVRSVLQLIADFTNLNVVVSDSVTGNLTLRLKNVPWDQALDIILKTKGLAMRQNGNVLLIAPAEEIAAREKLELEASKQVEELAPLRSEFIQINYANASELAALLKSKGNSLLSERGNVTIDTRTNTLLVQDTDAKLEEIRRLIARLDVPVRQVLIESRIVEATDKYTKELGVRFGISSVHTDNNRNLTNAVSGTAQASYDLSQGNTPALTSTYNVNLPPNTVAGSIGLSLIKLPMDLMLNLELAAAELENRIETISNPRVITANQQTARIETGTEIPYQQATSSGATSVSFKKAVLSLEVTPQITPDERVNMEIKVTKDSVGQIFNGVPSIDTNAVETRVLVENGQTVVLGGVFATSKERATTKTPFFGDLPVLGHLFRSDLNKDNKAELLIFLTPKILQETLTSSSR